MDKADQYAFDFVAFDNTHDPDALSAHFGSDFDIPLLPSFSFLFQNDLGFWGTSEIGGLAKGFVGLRWISNRFRTDLSAGADLAYSSIDGFKILPGYRLDWRMSTDSTLYTRGGMITGYLPELITAIRNETVDDINPVLPLQNSFTVGWTWVGSADPSGRYRTDDRFRGERSPDSRFR